MNWQKGTVIVLLVIVGGTFLIIDTAPVPATDNLDSMYPFEKFIQI